MPAQQDLPLACRRNLRDQRQCLGVAACLELRQQPRQDGSYLPTAVSAVADLPAVKRSFQTVHNGPERAFQWRDGIALWLQLDDTNSRRLL